MCVECTRVAECVFPVYAFLERPQRLVDSFGIVLPIGVLQQPAYQRTVPRGLSRRQRSFLAPFVMLNCPADIW